MLSSEFGGCACFTLMGYQGAGTLSRDLAAAASSPKASAASQALHPPCLSGAVPQAVHQKQKA